MITANITLIFIKYYSLFDFSIVQSKDVLEPYFKNSLVKNKYSP